MQRRSEWLRRRWLQQRSVLTFYALLLAALAGRGSPPAQAQTAAADRPAWMEAAPTSTGVAVGQKVPAFRLPDQNGRMQDFASLRGPNGLALYFNRSVDW